MRASILCFGPCYARHFPRAFLRYFAIHSLFPCRGRRTAIDIETHSRDLSGSLLAPMRTPTDEHPNTQNRLKVFLHVNEINEAALRLYESCGYDEAPDCASNRAFTNSLGLSGGFIGQRHRLLHKTFPIADASGGSGEQ